MDIGDLERFFKASFNDGELRRFLFHLRGGVSLLSELSGEGTSLAQLAFDAATLLQRQNRLNHDFFEALRAARPNRLGEINALERGLSAPGPGSEASPAPASQTVNNYGPVGSQGNVTGNAVFQGGGLEQAAPSAALLKILFLAANPVDTARLALDKEIRGIRERLQMAGQRDRFELQSAWAVRTGDLRQELLSHHPSVAHFSGHGTVGGIVLEGRDGRLQRVQGTALGSLFGLFSDDVKVVVLNACYSDEQAEAIAQKIPVVVGMPGPVADEAAILFADGFYQGLGNGLTVAKAVEMGKVAYELEGITATATPRMRCRADIDPDSFRLLN